ncbi:MAG: noncanonical pyrimidine nucleotidase, YjjG family [Ruminococcaceae bacterium]|nr:noncanonical pyrimidine nucleotidase, YjjG family [Oscillospiraceae bacterium]
MYKYLLWDIDGTILDFAAAEAAAIRALFAKYGLGDCTEEMLGQYIKINRKYWQALERNEISKQKVLVGRFQDFFALFDLDVTKAAAFNDDYQLALGDYPIFTPHAKEVLERQKGSYTLIAVTNGTKVAQTKKMYLTGLDKIFDAVFISEDVGVEKPNLEYFTHVFEKSGITDKAQVLIIGDSLTSDMRGGEIAGIDSCWFNPEHGENTQGISVTYEIDDLRQLSGILNQ